MMPKNRALTVYFWITDWLARIGIAIFAVLTIGLLIDPVNRIVIDEVGILEFASGTIFQLFCLGLMFLFAFYHLKRNMIPMLGSLLTLLLISAVLGWWVTLAASLSIGAFFFLPWFLAKKGSQNAT